MRRASMQTQRGLIEKLLRCGNAYANLYNQPLHFGPAVTLSPSQLQTLAFVLSGENQKMAQIASRLGITRGTFSKNVNKLLDKGLLSKGRRPDNHKDVFVQATALGQQVHEEYCKYMEAEWFRPVRALAVEVPKSNLTRLEAALELLAEMLESSI